VPPQTCAILPQAETRSVSGDLANRRSRGLSVSPRAVPSGLTFRLSIALPRKSTAPGQAERPAIWRARRIEAARLASAARGRNSTLDCAFVGCERLASRASDVRNGRRPSASGRKTPRCRFARRKRARTPRRPTRSELVRCGRLFLGPRRARSQGESSSPSLPAPRNPKCPVAWTGGVGAWLLRSTDAGAARSQIARRHVPGILSVPRPGKRGGGPLDMSQRLSVAPPHG
jgi:hypothetical protein